MLLGRSTRLAASRRAFLRGTLGLLAVVAGGERVAGNALSSAIRRAAEEPEPVAIGVYLPDALYDRSVLADFATAIRRQPDFLVWYEGWSNGEFSAEHRDNLERLKRWGMTPVIAWDPFDPEGPPIDQPDYALANIIRGNFDAYIDSWGKGLAAFGRPVFINFAHEMNGNWTPWGVGVNGNQPGEFVATWRYVHDRVRAAGARNVVWVWNPNVLLEGDPYPMAGVYPGDDYVDWFGMNGFNWGANIHWKNCDCQSAWRTFKELFDNTYRGFVSMADKPIMIGETASSEIGGDKAGWITNAYLEEIPNAYPRIRAVAWFNKIATGLDTIAPGVVEPTTSAVDWRVNSSPASLAAFTAAVNSPYYQGSLAHAVGDKPAICRRWGWGSLQRLANFCKAWQPSGT
jgi:hypothetical protein